MRVLLISLCFFPLAASADDCSAYRAQLKLSVDLATAALKAHSNLIILPITTDISGRAEEAVMQTSANLMVSIQAFTEEIEQVKQANLNCF